MAKNLPIDEFKTPHAHWEKVVLYSYLTMLGATQKDAASGVDRSESAVHKWEQDKPLMKLAREEAISRWMSNTINASRATLLDQIKDGGDAASARWVLERTVDELRPPTMRLGGDKENPIRIDDIAADDRKLLKELAIELAARKASGD